MEFYAEYEDFAIYADEDGVEVYEFDDEGTAWWYCEDEEVWYFYDEEEDDWFEEFSDVYFDAVGYDYS